MRVVLTGGGSGGHVSPMLAVAEALRELEPTADLRYIGVRNGLEADLVPRANIPIRFAPAIGMPGLSLSPAMFKFLFTLLGGVLAATVHLIAYRPHVIVASGGFASAPAVFASAFLRGLTFGLWRIPVYLHEQNAVPGRMNSAAARIARQVGVVHAVSLNRLPHAVNEVVGYPVRAGFASVDRATARRELGIPDDAEYVVVTGGSQGARTINRAVVDALPFLADRPKLWLTHSTGAMKGRGYDAVGDTRSRLETISRKPQHYRVTDYLHDMPLHLAAADLAVIRGGAGSLFEVCTQGLPALVIPKANLPGDSQVANARELAARGAIELLYEEPAFVDSGFIEVVPGELMAEKITALLDDPARRRELSEQAKAAFDRRAANRIAKRVVALAKSIRAIDVENDSTPTSAESLTETALPDSPTALRRYAEQVMGVRYERAFAHGPIRDWELEKLDDLAYFRYRGAALLAHSHWSMRNEGIKLLALTRHRDKLGLVLHVLTDRTPAPKLHRMLGGDFAQVGFVRRNAVNALSFMGVVNADVRAAIVTALDDPYYEVRSATLKLIRSMIKDGHNLADNPEIVSRVRKLTRDRNLEVHWEALHAFGFVGAPEDVLATNRAYAVTGKTPLREAVLRSYHALLDRYDGETNKPWREQLSDDIDHFAITSLAFHPHFPLKERYVSLCKRMDEEASA
ncbi:UDP-N-acetylglucosamine--N-acetylmuramyl-(pentapeptide) pyrophosphoryl-undecaprenol N-acetylglucosamine transferase [bacterium]|nr:UDP-N-acetylglucosamine--N-acetylmuramyl-(pentapeptide) pyrophosphoryl-undecaprenol N-acetylglucosamine transferase [bacterium]